MNSDTLTNAVLEVEAFLAACRVDHDRGTSWKRTPTSTKAAAATLYHGSAGVILFYLELHRATNDQSFLDTAVSGGDALLADLTDASVDSIAIYSGLPGSMFVLNELALASGEQRFRHGAAAATARIIDSAQPMGAGVGWIEPIPFSDITGITGEREVLDLSIGAAGAGVALLYAHRHRLDDRALDCARAAADRLLEMSVDGEDGPNWLMMADMPFPFDAPNFAHGAAGVGYLLADLHRATGDDRYLEVAIAAAGYVRAHSTPTDPDGLLVMHTEQNPDLHYLGVCHGPPGTGRFVFLLHEITEDRQWLDWLDANLAGLQSTGAPETRTDGLWQNVGQCCGDAGIGDYAVWLARATGDPAHRDLAERCAEQIMSMSTLVEGQRSWSQAEHRSRPDFTEVQTGFMQGAAGIGSFLLHLATTDLEVTSKIPFPDVPFRS